MVLALNHQALGAPGFGLSERVGSQEPGQFLGEHARSQPIAPTDPAIVRVNLMRRAGYVAGLDARIDILIPFVFGFEMEITHKRACSFERAVPTVTTGAPLDARTTLALQKSFYLRAGINPAPTIMTGSSVAASTSFIAACRNAQVRDRIIRAVCRNALLNLKRAIEPRRSIKESVLVRASALPGSAKINSRGPIRAAAIALV